MKKVLILGATGMLGSAVYGVLHDKYSLVLSALDMTKITLLEKAYGATEKHRVISFDAGPVYDDIVNKKGYPGEYMAAFLKNVGDVDYVINAIGLTIPFSLKNPTMTFFINSALPHLLARSFGEKLIHITTDCVYDGKEGYPYTEESVKTPTDLYGISKSLGEPENCLTIRTSIIGRELEGFTGLLEWFLTQKGKTITGFGGHFWNGITTKEFGRVCDRIMSEPEKYPRKGIFHVFSDSVSKYEMLKIFEEKYKIGCAINEDVINKLNRTLGTVKELNNLLKISSFRDMVSAL